MERSGELGLVENILEVSQPLRRGSCLSRVEENEFSLSLIGVRNKEQEENVLTPVHMLEHTLKPLPESLSVPLQRFLKSGFYLHMLRQTRQSPMPSPSTFTRTKPIIDHPGDVERLNFHPRKRFVVVGRALERARQDRSVSHHVFFHLKGENEGSRG